MWRAKELGGEKWRGWSIDTSLLADLVDALNFNTSATATNKKARLRHPVERPHHEKVRLDYKADHVDELDWGAALTALGA